MTATAKMVLSEMTMHQAMTVAELRDRIAHATYGMSIDSTDVLLELFRSGKVAFYPEDNHRSCTEAMREGALLLAGDAKHWAKRDTY